MLPPLQQHPYAALIAHDLVALSIIRRADERYSGPHISQTARGLASSMGTVERQAFRILDRLERGHLVQRSDEQRYVAGQYVTKRRAKQHTYSITPAGIEALEQCRKDMGW